MPCDFCVLRARSLVFLVLQVNSILNLNMFLVFAGRAGVENQSRGDSQTKDRKRLKRDGSV
jgi:hypothetical protein